MDVLPNSTMIDSSEIAENLKDCERDAASNEIPNTNSPFRIISSHIKENPSEKRYVVYTLQVLHTLRSDETTVATIDRRYTQFLELYTALNKNYSALMSGVLFPKKALIGNFENDLILDRSNAFDSLLAHISQNASLRNSEEFLNFLQMPELLVAKNYLSNSQYALALPLLENTFTLLNNVYTDRSTPVLIALCRLIICLRNMPAAPQSLKYALLAVHRFDGVSDSDLLILYIPLVHECIKILKANEQDFVKLERQLEDFSRQGINYKKCDLQEAVCKVEMHLNNEC